MGDLASLAEHAGVDVFRPHSLAALGDAARVLHDRKTSVLVVCGGDGTLMRCLSAIAQAFQPGSLPTFVHCHTGTVGNVPRNLGYQRNPRTLLDAVLHSPTALRQRSVPTLRVTTEAETFTAFSFGAGMVATFIQHYDSRGGGLSTALQLALQTFVGAFTRSAFTERMLRTTACRLSVNGGTLEPAAYSLIVSATVPSLGLGTRVTYQGGQDPQRPHLVASTQTAWDLGKQWPRTWRGVPLRGAGSVDALVNNFQVSFDVPSAIVLDGDVTLAREVRVEAGPCFTALVG